MKRLLALPILLPLILPGALAAQGVGATQSPPAGADPARVLRYSLDPAHSSVEFAVRHLGLSRVRGRIAVQSGTLMYVPEEPMASTVTVVLDVGSLTTGNERRDDDLKANYFHVPEHPRATFVSSRIERTAAGLRVHGTLTVAGTARSVALDVTELGAWSDPDGSLDRLGWEATTTLDRHDFGIANPGSVTENTGVIGDEVRVELQIESLRQNPTHLTFTDGERPSVGTRFRELAEGRSPAEAARALSTSLAATPAELNTGVREFLVLSLQLLWDGEAAAAAEVLRAATALHPDNARLWELRAESLWRAGNMAEAREAADRAHALDAGSAFALEMIRRTAG